MNLLNIVQSLNPELGGVSQAVTSMVLAFEEQSVICTVLTLDAPWTDYTISKKTIIHKLGPSGRFLNHSKLFKPWLVENLHKFDAVIVNGIWGYHTYALWKAVKEIRGRNGESKIPRVFIMPHGMLDPYFQHAKERWFKAIRNDVYWLLVEKSVINDADGLLFTCEKELLLARKTFWEYKPKSEYNIGWGIPQPPSSTKIMTADLDARQPTLTNDPYLLFLGRIDIKKGVDLLVKSYINLYQAQKGENRRIAKLVIAGPVLDANFARKLNDEISKVPEVKDFILFPGMLRGDAKWAAIYGCEAFILPSHQENFGIAVVEALGCGKPVLITDQVNICNEIKSEGAGIVGKDNLEGVQSMLYKWLNLTLEEKRQMSENAVRAFRRHFNLDQSIQRMTNIIFGNIK